MAADVEETVADEPGKSSGKLHWDEDDSFHKHVLREGDTEAVIQVWTKGPGGFDSTNELTVERTVAGDLQDQWVALSTPTTITSAGITRVTGLGGHTAIRVRVSGADSGATDVVYIAVRSFRTEIPPLDKIDPVLVSLGKVEGVSLERKFGDNLDVGTSDETVWRTGGLYPWASTADTLNVVSANAADDVAGAGAQQITIWGLDASFNSLVEVVDLDGTGTPVTTSGSFTRVNRVRVTRVGTYAVGGSVGQGANTGNITVTHTSSGNTLAFVPAETGSTFQAVYTVPNGYTAVVNALRLGVTTTNKRVAFNFRVRLGADDVTTPFNSLFSTGGIRGVADIDNITLGAPAAFPGKTDIEVRAASDAVATSLSAAFDIVLFENAKWGL